MAHFAEINSNNQVVRVVVINNSALIDEYGTEHECLGVRFCINTFGDGTWFQTSYNGTFRKNFASIGFTWDPVKQAFVPPQPFPSWILDEDTCKWLPPVAYPVDNKDYDWDEVTLSWVERNLPG